MQSGISVSSELHDAFQAFTSDTSQFALPITINSESLKPRAAIPFSGSFYSSLPRLQSVLEPKTPLFLVLRHSPSIGLVALTYIPSNAGVRAKTLFASTRATLTRELGSEKFVTTIFATEEEEVFGEDAWKERDLEGNGTSNASYKREDLMDEKERELEAVRRAEEEARHGTAGRDVGTGGSLARASGIATGGGIGVNMPVDEDAKTALRSIQDGGLVQLSIAVKSETITLAAAESNISANAVASKISDSAPRYTFYHYPGSDVVIFIYTCPTGSSIKEKMLYASTRRGAIQLAEAEGVRVSKKIEGSSPDEITEARLNEEVYNLRAAVTVLFEARAFETVESVADTLATADDTFVLVVTEGALVTHAHERCWPHVGIAYRAFAVALVTESADGDAWLFAAHDKIGVMAGHGDRCQSANETSRGEEDVMRRRGKNPKRLSRKVPRDVARAPPPEVNPWPARRRLATRTIYKFLLDRALRRILLVAASLQPNMAEETLPSAVSVPQPEENASPEAGQKRRKSSVSENGTKRRRISDQHEDDARPSPPQPTAGQAIGTARPSRNAATATEERKRGQRLFGGLLGTLSQTPSTVAQKRRADIEQRQQAKLKLQNEQQSEARRKEKEDMMIERRKQQRDLEASSMGVRHRNLLQAANFLRTKVEPVLLWRPFQLRDEDEDAIARQRQEVNEIISKEKADFEERWHGREEEEETEKGGIQKELNTKDGPSDESRETNETSNGEKHTSPQDIDSKSGKEIDQSKQEKERIASTSSATDRGDQSTDGAHMQSTHQRPDDEGEEVMEEDKEDMVLY
ncbi:hypothetical protein UA08_06647 [Talaromyces atroroseus]|uniref:Twinfilin n=1 Tax=Talaromyces atroroseus TaxID=1441469 RepID=A0A225AGA7_TALAT|nr:hypothetical protein UA08_06647 [Talaromyces atroroseus]OKL58193.1 hypothetical protein UA08_06647 [Talaromyces atroroseus]